MVPSLLLGSRMKCVDVAGEQGESTAVQANTLFANSTGLAWEKPFEIHSEQF